MSATTAERWHTYLKWNRALADVVYSPEMAGMPAYLDPEPEVLEATALAVAARTDDPRRALVEAVRLTLNPPGHSAGMFGGHVARLMRWRPASTEPPPVIGLLTILCLAAEDMRESDGFAANNYYDRLMPMLGVSSEADKNRVITAYRKLSFDLWESLNTWLETLRGDRGLPTAYSYAHEHIGRPLSQALIRAADRAKLEDFFADTGFERRSRISSEDLEPLLNEWIHRSPSPASHQIQALWKRSGARERILEIASNLLETWEPPSGLRRRNSSGRTGERRSALRLVALLRTFPSPVLELSVVGPDVDGSDTARLVDANDGQDLGVDVGLERLPDGRWRLLDAEEFEGQSLAEGAIRLTFASGADLERRPRRVVPLKKDDLLQAFIEVERLGLGEDGMVMCASGLAAVVDDALRQIARPGFRRLEPPPRGCPPDWALFTHVQVLAPLLSAASSTGDEWPLDLNVLQPLSSSQLVIQGGLQLPGRIRRWSSRAAPEIRVAADGVDAIRLTIERVATFQETVRVLETEVDEPVMLLNLQMVDLPDGDYEVTATGVSESKRRTLNTARLRLRSGDSRNPVPSTIAPLATRTAGQSPIAIFALPWYGDTAAVRGPEVLQQNSPGDFRQSPVGIPGWWVRRHDPSMRGLRDDVDRTRLRVARATTTDCFQTGAHVLQLPTFYGKSTTKTIEGVCKHCGLVKRYPGSYYRLRKRSATPHPRVRSQPAFDIQIARPVIDEPGVTSDIALDALSHDGAGGSSWLEQVALQVEPSQLFVDRLVRALELLGHAEVERIPMTLAVTSWELMSATLVGIRRDCFVLAGLRSRRLEHALVETARNLGIQVKRSAQGPVAPDRVAFHGEITRVAALAERSSAIASIQVTVMEDAGRRIAAALPPLNHVIASLPRQAMVSARSIKRWSSDLAIWRSVGDASMPGSYQLLSPTPVYCVRDDNDIMNGTMRRVDARLAKHAAAAEQGTPLVGYDRDTGTLYVPLGADLPGLYGRAAVLCSGQLPFEDEAQRVTRYSLVPQEVAEHIAALLRSEVP